MIDLIDPARMPDGPAKKPGATKACAGRQSFDHRLLYSYMELHILWFAWKEFCVTKSRNISNNGTSHCTNKRSF